MIRHALRWFAGCVLVVLMMSASMSAAQQPETTPEPCPPFPAGVPENYTYYVGLGDSLFERMSYSAAIRAYTCGLELQPNDASIYADRGYAYAALGESTLALADYDQALALDELLIAAYVNRGALYTRLGNFGLAVNDLTLAITLAPDNVTALNNRAVIHAIEQNYDLALADLDAAIQVAPQNAEIYATRAAVYSALASRDYQQVVMITESNVLPAGTPSDVLVAVDDSIRTGDFSVWLSLLTPDAGVPQ